MNGKAIVLIGAALIGLYIGIVGFVLWVIIKLLQFWGVI